MFDSSVVEELPVPEKTLSIDAAIMVNEFESKQEKRERIDAAAPASLGATAESYRANNKAKAAKPRMKEVPDNRMLMKESVSSEIIEERKLLNDRVEAIQEDVSLSEEGIGADKAKIKNLELIAIKELWESGEINLAKIRFDDFKTHYPDETDESIKKILGNNIYMALIK
jgi:hypothetical protein